MPPSRSAANDPPLKIPPPSLHPYGGITHGRRFFALDEVIAARMLTGAQVASSRRLHVVSDTQSRLVAASASCLRRQPPASRRPPTVARLASHPATDVLLMYIIDRKSFVWRYKLCITAAHTLQQHSNKEGM